MMTNTLNSNNNLTLTTTGLLNTGTALKDGNVYLWGTRTHGMSGDGMVGHPVEPLSKVSPPGTVVSLSGTDKSLHALSSSGDLYGWGANSAGDVGSGRDGTEPLPFLILQNITQVISKIQTGFALDKSGQIWAWGSNYYNQLSSGSFKYRNTPAPVILHGEKTRLLGGGYESAFAVTTEGHIWVWGLNVEAALGTWDSSVSGNSKNIIFPERAPALEPYAHQIVHIDRGCNFGMALLSDGRLIGWGRQQQLGIGAEYALVSPEPVEIMTNIAKMHVATNTVVALTRDGAIYTFGKATRFGTSHIFEGAVPVLRMPAGSAVDIGGNIAETVYYKTPVGKVYGVGMNSSGEINVNDASSRIQWPGVETVVTANQS